MARFYLDHNVQLDLARYLRGRGHEVATARDRLLTRAPDHHQLLTAASEAAILVTLDRDDFILLHGAWHDWSHAWGIIQDHAGILVMEQAHFSVLGEAIEELLTRRAIFTNELHIWRRRRGWITA